MYNALCGEGKWPEEFGELFLDRVRADKLGCTWYELQSLPATLIDDIDIILEAEAMYRKVKNNAR